VQYITGDASFGATPAITSIAFTGYNIDTVTQMFGFDANTGGLIMFDNTNALVGYGNGSSGYINTDISLNSVLSLLAHTSAYNNSYINIAFDPTSMSNIGFMASNYLGDSGTAQLNYSVLYDMSSMLTGYHKGTTGTPTTIGRIGYGTPVKDIAIRRAAPVSTGVVAYAGNPGNDLLVYPNPVLSQTKIVLDVIPVSDVFVDILDLNGRVDRSFQYTPGTSVLDVDMSRLPTGLYSVRVSGNDIGSHNLKVVKE
jgi:type IX secretion system substrate protein